MYLSKHCELMGFNVLFFVVVVFLITMTMPAITILSCFSVFVPLSVMAIICIVATLIF